MKAYHIKLEILIEGDAWRDGSTKWLFQFLGSLYNVPGYLDHAFIDPLSDPIEVNNYKNMEVDFEEWFPPK